jgi:MinD-like ATPase involved in chromosome partitioning or flagellar assembly
MLVSCWSAKGGSGTTVVSVALASLLARSSPTGSLLVDLDGDVPAVLGLPEPSGPGVLQWLAAGDVPPDALPRLEVEAAPGLGVVPRGTAEPASPALAARADVLAAVLGADPRSVVVDCGSAPTGPALALAAAADQSLLVLRPCYLALRRAVAAPLRPSGVILVAEDDRTLTRHDIEDVLGVPVRAEIRVEPAVARAVDAGLLSGRLPRALERSLRRAA